MIDHTQTQLCISSQAPTIIKCADFMGETSVIFASASGYNGSGFFTPEKEAPHNARRLVACWNWCDGLSTEALEGHVSAGRTAEDFAISSVGRESALAARLEALTAQRDALLAALRVAVRQNEHDMLMTGEELRAASAAIAAAEKGGSQ